MVESLQPRSVLDVGCGTGELVARFRSLGVDATGCELSKAILNRAMSAVRPLLHRMDVSELSTYPSASVALVVCMELLEHLPVSRIEATIDELRRIARGAIFITTPSFGPDATGHYDLPMHDTWLAEARANRRFSQIVMDPEGRPHHGHLTLASYRWWTERSLSHDLACNHALEQALFEHSRRSLARWRLNPYVLHEVRSSARVVGETCVRQGVSGWHDLERELDGRRFRWTSTRATSILRAQGSPKQLRIIASGGPPALVDDPLVEVVVRSALGMQEIARRTITVPLGRWEEILLEGLRSSEGLVHVALEPWRTFRPARLPGGSDDHRELGIQVCSIALE